MTFLDAEVDDELVVDTEETVDMAEVVDMTEMVGTPPDATPAAPDALGEVELDEGRAAAPDPDPLPVPPTMAPTPHWTGP